MPEPIHLLEGVQSVQKMFDGEQLAAGLNLVTKKATCEWTFVIGSRTLKCNSRAIMQRAEAHACGECEKTIKTVEARFCLVHGIDYFGRRLRPESLQIAMDLGPEHAHHTVVREIEVDGQEARVVTDTDEPHEHLTDGEIATAFDGTTGTPIAKARPQGYDAITGGMPRDAIIPMWDDPTSCVCGWLIASAVSPTLHSQRHADFVDAVDAQAEFRDANAADTLVESIAEAKVLTDQPIRRISEMVATATDAPDAEPQEPAQEPENEPVPIQDSGEHLSDAPTPRKRAARGTAKKTTTKARAKKAVRA